MTLGKALLMLATLSTFGIRQKTGLISSFLTFLLLYAACSFLQHVNIHFPKVSLCAFGNWIKENKCFAASSLH